MATTKITKVQRFEDIKALLSGEAATHGTTIEDALAFADKEIALLSKKNTSTSKKETETQRQNEVYKTEILEFLSENPKSTATTVMKAVSNLAEWNVQKTSNLLKQLREAGKVERSTEKGVTYFSLS